MGKLKRNISIMLIITLLAISIAGCSTESESSKKTNIAMGRYIETGIELPQDTNDETFFQLGKSSDGYPVLYSCNKDARKKGVYKYTLKENGEWLRDNIPWLADICVPIPDMSSIIFGENREQYFYYPQEIDSFLYSHLVNTDGKIIELEGWNDKTSKYTYPSGVALLQNGNMICNYQEDIITYDKNTFKIVTKVPNGSPNSNGPITIGQGFALITGSDNGNSSHISLYDVNATLSREIPIDTPIMEGNTSIYATEDNSIVMCNTDGIHLLGSENKVWETLVDGALTSLSLPSLYSRGIIQASAKEYYILYSSSDDAFKLMKYSYDKTVSTKPETELSIYSLADSSVIREAMNVFQSKNPNVAVTLRVSMNVSQNNNSNIATARSNEDTATNKTDYIKALNTELLSGNGSDLILLDELPVASYIEKGGLLDISDIVNPMLASGELLPNIFNNYKTGEKLYSIPLRYSIPLVFGKPEVVKSSSTLESLADYSDSHKNASLFGKLSYSDLLNQFLPIHSTTLFDKEGMLKKQELINFLEKLKIISNNTNCALTYNEDERKSSIFGIAENTDISLENTQSILDSSFSISVINFTKGIFTSYENSFVPIGEIGINASSKQKELAKQFIKTLLSTEIQNQEFWDGGFPVNAKSLELWRSSTKESYKAETEIGAKDGKSYPLHIRWPKKEEINKLVDICESVSNKTIKDDVLFNMFVEETTKFFEGTMTAEAAADAIIARAKVYLSE